MYDFKKVEEEILELWEDNKIYNKVKEKNKKGKKFYFLQGPPYTSGRLHIAHAWNNGMKDMVMRYKRMKGFNVWDRAGYDMHGLPTANKVQKKLKLKDKDAIKKFGVGKFIKECINFSTKNAEIMNKDLWRLGVWMDYENAYLPIKTEFIEGMWWFIKKAHKQDRLYKGKKIMQWCSSCETSLAKHELEYENVKDNSIFLKFKVKGKKNEYLVVWTTTPWTIPYNLAVMVNPELKYVKAELEWEGKKEKWIVAKDLVTVFVSGLLEKKFEIVEEFKGKELLGLEYVHPFYSKLKEVYDKLKKKWEKVHTVILSEEYVDTSSGSGLVHSAPGCGPEDFEVGKEYGIGAFNRIDEQGIFRNMGDFTGLQAKKDDYKFVEKLKDNGSLITENEIEHEYAHCWRCHKPVVFRATEQWFLKIEDLISKLLKFNEKVGWQPDFAGKNYDLWTENLKDNGLTRQRFWGCPMPLWICDKCKEVEVIGSKKELEKKSAVPDDLHRPWIDKVTWGCKCGGKFKRVEDVIDVWIDSGTTSWNCLDYPKTDKHIKLFPTDFILEATEQIKLWFSMLQICSAIAFGKSAYNAVYTHGMILDYQGMKMSKSLGNIISPYEVVDKYGADILRYYMFQTTAGQNINFNWDDVKIKHRNLNIFYNISRLLLGLHKRTKETKNLDIEEKWMLSRKNNTIKKVTELMEQYRLDEVIKEIEELFLDLSRTYIQFTREKANEKPDRVFTTIKDVYTDTLKIFSIISPFITDKVWQDLKQEKLVKEESVHLCRWPKFDEKKIDENLEKNMENVNEIIEAGLAVRSKEEVGLKWPLPKAVIKTNSKLNKELKEIIMRQLNIKKVEIKKGELKVELDTKMNKELEAEGFARELTRKIQSQRKKAGLVKTDKIEISIVVDKELLSQLKLQENFIKERVNAKRISLASKEKETFKNSFDFEVKGRKFFVTFQKV